MAGSGNQIVGFEGRLAELRHELRTPIGHIIGYAELIEEDLTEDQRRAYGHDLSAILGAGQKMLAIIDQHLNAQKKSIEKELFLRLRSLFALNVDLVFYDLGRMDQRRRSLREHDEG